MSAELGSNGCAFGFPNGIPRARACSCLEGAFVCSFADIGWGWDCFRIPAIGFRAVMPTAAGGAGGVVWIPPWFRARCCCRRRSAVFVVRPRLGRCEAKDVSFCRLLFSFLGAVSIHGTARRLRSVGFALGFGGVRGRGGRIRSRSGDDVFVSRGVWAG